ncbi:MAG: hypothetical protein Q9224_004482 [Gallowayella concinna]
MMDSLPGIHLQPLAQLVLCAFAVYVVGGGFYRLYLSPLAKFPGPKLAALTYWFELYYDLVQGGRYQARISEMHKQHGPIVRINPNELHIKDTEFYDQLYRRENKLDKYPGQTKMFGVPNVHFTSELYEVHRLRRLPLAPYFSKKSVAEMSRFIEERLNVLCRRIRDCHTNDYHQLLVGFVHSCHFIRHFTWLFNLMQSLPDFVILRLQPSLRLANKIMKKMETDIHSLSKRLEIGSPKAEPGIFVGLLESNLPSEDKVADRMSREGMALLVAGSETTAQTLSITTYHIMANSGVVTELRKQLESAIPQADVLPPLAQLEAIPYLHACVQEGLRISYGISGRLMRVSKNPIEYRDWVIAPGTPVGMSTVFMHDDETVFPDHRAFKPERWLEKREDGTRLDKYLTSFGKGDRQCIGMKWVCSPHILWLHVTDEPFSSLAQAELYMTIASIFRQFDLELFETERSTVEYYRDYFNSFPKSDCDGVKVLVK